MEFYYHPCGEEREWYDVFASEQECIKTCLHKGKYLTIGQLGMGSDYTCSITQKLYVRMFYPDFFR